MTTQSPKMKSMFGGQPEGGFFDLPLLPPGEVADSSIVLMGAPGATPYSTVGSYCAEAPAAIRKAFGWPGVLRHHDFDIDGYLLPDNIKTVDWGDLDHSDTDFSANRELIQNQVGKVLAADAIPLVMPGADIGGRGALVAARIVAMVMGLAARQKATDD